MLKDYAASSLKAAAEKADGTLDAAKYDAWVNKHADALRVFPDLQMRFGDVKAAQDTLDQAILDAKENRDAFQKSTAATFIGTARP